MGTLTVYILSGRGKILEVYTEQRIELHGFNNLTKSLSFNMYDICYSKEKLTNDEQEEIKERLQTEMEEIFYGTNMNQGRIH